MAAIVIVTTVGEEEQALLIARELVSRRLAACVNVVPGMRSVYRWQGKICRDTEYLLLVKTLDTEFEAAAAAIRELHSYELPEILSFAVASGEEGFLAWIRDSVDKSALAAGAEEDEDEEALAGLDLDDSAF
jgi:periplasmic divalent cation tolerance protein